MTTREFLKQSDHPDARLLVVGSRNWTLSELLLHLDEELLPEEEEKLMDGLRRIRQNEPLQYVLQKAPFFGRDFYVDHSVLIPRFDSETLVNEALKAIPEGYPCSVLDCCTGSGCIGLTVLAERPEVSMTLSDISPEALRVASVNARRMGLSPRLTESDLFDRIPERFSLILCNPPYIPTEVIGTLEENVREHEPLLALDGGKDGLVFYRRLARDGREHLLPGGIMILEIGYDEGEAVRTILDTVGYSGIQIIKDLSGLDRVVKACWNN